jgi:hypothetical protein
MVSIIIIGGFVRSGEGPRAAGYNASQGGQFRTNITKELESATFVLVLRLK